MDADGGITYQPRTACSGQAEPCDGADRGACTGQDHGHEVHWDATVKDINAPREVTVGCMYSDQDPIDVLDQIAGQIQQAFVHLPINGGTLTSQPGPATLIKRDTNFHITAADQEFTITLLGQSVHITATPVEYTYDYGDGTSTGPTEHFGPMLTDEQQFTPTATSHQYQTTGNVTAHAISHFTGTYSVNGGPAIPIPGHGEFPTTNTAVKIYRVEIRNVATDCSNEPTAWGCGSQ